MQLDFDGDTVLDPQIERVVTGSVEIWFNQGLLSCEEAVPIPIGLPNYQGLTVRWVQAYDEGGGDINLFPVPWRKSPCGDPPDLPCNPNPFGSFRDFDRDGCDDEDELAQPPPLICGDDPYNPDDSFSDPATADLSGAYEIVIRVLQGTSSQLPGAYFNCRSYLEHDTGDSSVSARTYCYMDSPAIDINPEGYPGKTGDGFWGAPPPGPETGQNTGRYAYGRVGETHTELIGAFD